MTWRSLRGDRGTICSCFMVPEGNTGFPDFLARYPWKLIFLKFVFKCEHFKFTKNIHTVSVAWHKFMSLDILLWDFQITRLWLLRQKPINLLPKVIWRSRSNHRYLKSCMAIMDVITNNYARYQISSSTSSYLARKLFDWRSYWYWLEMECKMHKCRFFIFFVIVAVDAVIMHISTWFFNT